MIAYLFEFIVNTLKQIYIKQYAIVQFMNYIHSCKNYDLYVCRIETVVQYRFEPTSLDII